VAVKKKSPSTKDLKPRVVKSGQAASVKGGRATIKDLTVTKPVDKGSTS
jgi:hypothetical protein